MARADRARVKWRSVGDALTRGRAGSPPDIPGAIEYAYGTGRGGRPNTRAAAEALGVSQRTVQRWMKAPPAHSAGVDELHRQAQAAAESPERRRQALNPRRAARIRASGAQVKFSGMTVVSHDRRRRDVTYRFTGEQLAPVVDAYLEGGEAAGRAALTDVFREHYGGVGLETIDRLEFKR